VEIQTDPLPTFCVLPSADDVRCRTDSGNSLKCILPIEPFADSDIAGIKVGVLVELPNAAWQGDFVGMVRLVLALPLCGLVRSSLTMTEGNCNFWQTVSLPGKRKYAMDGFGIRQISRAKRFFHSQS